MDKITIGIPSYNEQYTITSVLEDLDFISRTYPIFEVIISDDSDDNTQEAISQFSAKHSLNIKLVHHVQRRSAAAAWNEIFQYAEGDIIILFDADVVIDKNCVLELAKSIKGLTAACASNPTPVGARGITARSSAFVSKWLRTVRQNGLSQYTMMGRGLSIKSSVAKSIIIPPEIIAIDLFLQCAVSEKGYEVTYNDNALVYFKPASKISEFASQVNRSLQGHKQIKSFFNLENRLSLSALLKAALENSIRDPAGAICTAVSYICLPFYRQDYRMQSGKWDIARSTKIISRDDIREM